MIGRVADGAVAFEADWSLGIHGGALGIVDAAAADVVTADRIGPLGITVAGDAGSARLTRPVGGADQLAALRVIATRSAVAIAADRRIAGAFVTLGALVTLTADEPQQQHGAANEKASGALSLHDHASIL